MGLGRTQALDGEYRALTMCYCIHFYCTLCTVSTARDWDFGSLDLLEIKEIDIPFHKKLACLYNISGRIKFGKSVSVGSAEGVVMEEGGTVNGVDPSSLQAMIADVEDIIIEEEVNFTSPLLVSMKCIILGHIPNC